ncbi:LuxR family transcriptional regulator [Isoptericola luteus]|nr:LuxR family transcriptional regulator [Isoptericola sp. NEAU-Y5]
MGRRSEREAVEKLLSLARSGRSGSLVLRGEPGIGKTVLLEHAQQTAIAAGFRVESLVGVESETHFAFAGLHQLCGALLGHARVLPAPQQAALGVAFGLHDGDAPDRFLVGLAVLSLLAEVAEERPLLCLVDDAQWLDEASAQALAFAARRLGAERLALVFAVRDSDEGDRLPLTGLSEMRLERLAEPEARALLGTAVRAPLDEGVREQILAEAGGNPLALLELPRAARPADLAGGFELPDALSVPRRVEDTFRRRSASLPPQTQLLLLVAAADPTGNVALLWRATAHLGLDPEAATPAEAAGLLEVRARVRFRHPLVRSAVYQSATAPDRRRAHGALAETTDPAADPDRRAWHRALAVLGADEDAAADLERSAGRARGRGGVAAAAAFLRRAAELTPDPAARARRALEGAHALQEAGAPESALELLAVASSGPLDALPRARLALLRAQIAFYRRRGSEVPGMLLDAARTLTPLDPALARQTYLQALDTALVTGDLDRDVLAVAEAARAAPAPPSAPQPPDLLLDGLVTALTQGYETGAPGLRLAIEAFLDTRGAGPGPSRQHDRWLRLAGRNAVAILDDELLLVLAGRNVQRARESGALATLPDALRFWSITSVLLGDLARAGELATEATAITHATGGVHVRHAHAILGAWRGDRAETTAPDAAGVGFSGRSTEAALAQYAMSVLHNGRGDYRWAQEAAARALESPELSLSNLAHFELVESAARAGQPRRAAEAAEQLCARARASGTPWALGMAARAEALTRTGPAAEDRYREAIAQLAQSRVRGYLARTRLVYGEWLRREGRRRDARDQLRTAHQLLTDMGADAFAARAARELRATGEHPRARTARPTDGLTAQELHVARLVATGATSREVGTQLFLSPRTVEAHLRNIFRKLGVTSRRDLRALQLS